MERKEKKSIERRKKISILMIFLLLLSIITNSLIFFTPLVKIADAGDIVSYIDSNTSITVSVLGEPPRINWYDLQNKANSSLLNQQMDVNQEYYFKINISSDQGWVDIDYVNITAWYDNGSDANVYNQTSGGNLNMFLQYENTTATGNSSVWRIIWPDDEASSNSSNCQDAISNDPYGSWNNTECHNLTIAFTPGYQFRYAPGTGNSTAGFNDDWSWNFNITVTDESGNYDYVNNEFGVYSYTEIASVGIASLTGNPGYNATDPSGNPVNLTTRSNGNYSLAVDIDDLQHKIHPTANMSNKTLWIKGGNKLTFSNLTGSAPIYLYGNQSIYLAAEDDNTSLYTDNIEYKCSIPIVQLSGDYNATVYYHLRTETG